MTVTFGARLHAAMPRPRPALRRHRPARRPAARTGGSSDDVGRARAVRARPRSRRSRRTASVVKPQSAFYERFGSRGVAVLERVIADCPGGRGAGAARREARRHRLHLPGLRRRLPRPGAPRWPPTRSPPARTSASARSTRCSTPPPARRRRVRARADLQQGGPGGPARHRRRRAAPSPAASSTSCAASTTAPSRSARSAPWSAPPSARPASPSTSTGRCSRPGTAPRAAPPADLRRIFGAGRGVRSCPAPRASCSRSGRTRTRCATAYAGPTTSSPGSPDEAGSPSLLCPRRLLAG